MSFLSQEVGKLRLKQHIMYDSDNVKHTSMGKIKAKIRIHLLPAQLQWLVCSICYGIPLKMFITYTVGYRKKWYKNYIFRLECINQH